MRILLVEDSDDDVELVHDGLVARQQNVELVVARSRDSAVQELDARHFDLLVCDLMIPTVDGGLDTALAHGIAVYEHSQRVAAGLPAIFFSAFGSEEVLEQHVLPQVRQDSPFGRTTEPMLQFKDKGKVGQCLDIVERFQGELAELSAIQLLIGDEEIQLEEADERLIRICARQYGARSVQLSPLSGGLSGARIFQLDGFDLDGNPRLHVALKTEGLEVTDREVANFRRLAGLVAPGVLAPQAMVLRAGASGRGGVVYSLAADHQSLFRLIREDLPKAASAVERLAEGFAPVAAGGVGQQLSVGDMRRRVLSNGEMAEIAERLTGIDVVAVERLTVQGRAALVHGDLHGSNVLVSHSGQPLVIDFGSVQDGSASFDPIVLELSLAFHPYGRRIEPSIGTDTGDHWVDLNRYETACAAPAYVRACRTWARLVAGSEGELLANAYAWSVRQFRYEGANHALALRIARAASIRLLELTG